MEGAESDAPTAPQEPIKVEIEKFTGKKHWLGGFRHKLNDKGMFYKDFSCYVLISEREMFFDFLEII